MGSGHGARQAWWCSRRTASARRGTCLPFVLAGGVRGCCSVPQIADHGVQEDVVRRSGLDWTLVQPVYLTDGDEPAARSTDGSVEGMKVSRRAVGEVLARLATGADDLGRCVSVSGAPVAATV